MTINADPVRQRMEAANPARRDDEVPDAVMTASALLDVIDDRSGAMTHKHDSQAQGSPVATRQVRTKWAAAFAAGFGVILIAGIAAGLFARGDNTVEMAAPGATTATVTNATDSSVASVILPNEWDPILATTVAKATPPAATCPADTDPNVAGPQGQDQPQTGGDGGAFGAFDIRTGRIVYVDTADETWTFDVCTNTWHQMNAAGATRGLLTGGLVYDADSDVVIALASGHVSVYDNRTNAWSWLPSDFLGPGVNQFAPDGGVYDPITGLIITTNVDFDHVDVWAYDVDTNTATRAGRLSGPEGEGLTGFELLGYSQEIDRLIFGSLNDVTALVDPRTGETTLISTPTPSVSRLWREANQASSGATVHVAQGIWRDDGGFQTRFPGLVCGFDPDVSAWTSCFEMRGGSLPYRFDAMVGDPINNRLVFINGVNRSFALDVDGDVWAVDLDTGATTELLTPIDP